MSNHKTQKIIKFIKKEILHVIPAIIFFLISFNLLVFTERLMIRHTSSTPYLSYALASVTALIVGKFLLIVDNLRIINAFSSKPLVYNIAWKFFVYAWFILLFRLVDKTIHLSFKYHHPNLIYDHVKDLFVTPIFWAIQIWLLILFFIYIVSVEVVHAIGKQKIKQMFFGDKTS